MSAGKIKKSRYESAVGIHLIEIDEQTEEASFDGTTNSPPSDGIDSPFAAVRSRGARAYGLKPRFVSIEWDTAAPSGYRRFARLLIPVLTQSVFDGISLGDSGSYLGQNFTVTGKIDESILPGEAVIAASAPSP